MHRGVAALWRVDSVKEQQKRSREMIVAKVSLVTVAVLSYGRFGM